MEHEFYLQIMHGDIGQEDYPYEFDQAVMEMLPQARAALRDHELLDDPLGSIKASVPLISVFAESAPEIAFRCVCNILVFIEVAYQQGLSEEQILDTLLGEDPEE